MSYRTIATQNCPRTRAHAWTQAQNARASHTFYAAARRQAARYREHARPARRILGGILHGLPGAKPFPSLEEIRARESLLLVGTAAFRDGHVEDVRREAERAGLAFEIEDLTPGYEDARGHALVRLHDFRADARRD